MALALLLAFPSCSKKSTSASDTAANAQKASDLAAEVRSLEHQEEKLRREIELEKLAMEREELRLQREALATKGQRLSEEELALEKMKMALAKQQADDAESRSGAATATVAPSSTTNQTAAAAPVVSVSASSIGDYDYRIFYNRLAGHGSWFQSPDYGYVWRPQIVIQNRDWRPYTMGRWAYTDYGWTWISSEPFGWATYHYGRWILLRNSGWCWIPGNQWAPAWVCWKSSGDYVGWAPLPPESLYWHGNDWSTCYGQASGISPRCFNFVRVSALGGSVVNAVLSVSECVRVYQQTNYCGGYRWDQRRVHCDGVSYDFISRRVATPLPHYRCDFDAKPPTHLDPLRYVATRGDRLSIHAPNFNVPWNGALRPTVVESHPLKDEVVRDSAVTSEWRSRFAEARTSETRLAEESMRTGLAQKMVERIALEEKIQSQRGELAETLQNVKSESSAHETTTEKLPVAAVIDEKETTPIVKEPSTMIPPLSQGQDADVAEAPQPGRPRPGAVQVPQEEQVESERVEGPQPGRPRPGAVQVPQEEGAVSQQVDGPQPGRPAPSMVEGPQPGRPAPGMSGRASLTSRENGETSLNPLRQQQEQLAEKERAAQQEQEAATRAQQALMQQQQREANEKAMQLAQQAQQAKQLAEEQEKAREMQMQQQQQAEREAQDLAQAEKMQEQAVIREAQEAARQEQMRQQQEAMREAQEAARQEQMRQQQEAMREAQEAARQEQMRQQQEAKREAQEAARQEQMRQQQEAMREAQEAARQEQMRQQQEAMREAQEAARQEQMRQQQEAMREAQERARQELMRDQSRSQQDQGLQMRTRDDNSTGGLRRFR